MSVLHLLSAPVSVAAGYELGHGRLVPTVVAMVSLVSVVVGVLALVRSRRAGGGNGRAFVALGAGLACVVVGGLHAANSAGGLGTGNGLAGAVIAVVLGVAGMAAGGLALVRRRAHLAG
jgi:hypothetical protein